MNMTAAVPLQPGSEARDGPPGHHSAVSEVGRS